jgi:16S rRNA A1518/A1519 N6-dimethyltransferase RsmA/KsgA/DIM1 with predicted DNA glycosylase/AP lyase activity
MLCVDLGAGKGMVTEAALASGCRVLSIEKDPRLVIELNRRFGKQERAFIVQADLSRHPLPMEPFICVANPPFNLSTRLVSRWMTADTFVSGAIIVQEEFGRRITGRYGSTKLSVSLSAVLDLDLPLRISPMEFRPRPRCPVVVLRAARRREIALDERDRLRFWIFVNVLFETGRRTLCEALSSFRTVGIPALADETALRDAKTDVFLSSFRKVIANPDPRLWRQMVVSHEELPVRRRGLVPVVDPALHSTA